MITAETIERIVSFDGHDLPVLSAYVAVAVDPGNRAPRSHAASLMHTIRPLTENGTLGHAARVSLRADIERVEEASQQDGWKPGTMAVFACSGAGFYEEVALGRTVRDRAVADATPFTRPMLAILGEYHRACVVVIDREAARTWELYQGELRETGRLEDETMRKADYAGFHGLEERGVRNRAAELAKRHFRHVAVELASLCGAAGSDLIIVGGHREELSPFIEMLPSALRSIDRVTRSARCVSNEAGKKRSGCLVMPLFGMRYAAGRTPTIRTLRPSSCTDSPTRDSEPPNVERQSAWLISATSSLPCSPSSGRKVRPRKA